MFPFFPPPASNQPQLPFDSPNQQLRPPMHGGAPSCNIRLQPPAQAGFDPQNPNLILPWPYQTNGINLNVGNNVPLAMQFGLHQQQQQQLQNFNTVTPAQFPQNPQNVGQGANQIQGMLPVNALVLQQCLQSILSASNQMAGFANPVVSQPAVAPADSAKFRSVDQQQLDGGPLANCWNARPEMPVASSQGSWPRVVPDLQQVIQAQNNLLAGVFQTPQESKNEMRGNNISHANLGKSTSANFKVNPNGSWKGGQSQGRFQKPQSCNMINGKGNFRQFTGNRDKGTSSGRQRHPQHAKFDRDPQTAPRRSLSVTYTKQEILQWREARKRNYPTKSKIEKKLDGVADSEAQSRRQQLKEILAKQAELGVEVAELPPNYLSESKNKAYKREGPRKVQERRGRFQYKFNKRGRRGQDKQYSKRQRPERPADNLAPVKRSPTLLQKLLSAEIKQDKVYLLQVFRFMTLNSFFDNWPEKPLVFPQVTARDTGNGTAEDLPSAGADGVCDEVLIDSVVDGIGGDDKSNNGEAGSDGRLVSTSESDDEEEDGGHENCGKSEEGEITE